MAQTGLHFTTFAGGAAGPWTIERISAIAGETLPEAGRLDVVPDSAAVLGESAWSFRGVVSHVRYVERPEKLVLDAASPPLGRAEALCGALIPIRKSPAWWALTQDERRAIFEGRSRHIADSLDYLPRVARRLYHARDLGETFDFLTWFEFAPQHEAAFSELLAMLRSREEWRYVEREVEIRVRRL